MIFWYLYIVINLLGLSIVISDSTSTIVEPVGIIMSASADNYVRVFEIDSNYASDFVSYKEITGEWHDAIVSHTTHNLIYNLTCNNKTYKNLLYVNYYFSEISHNGHIYPLAKLTLHDSTLYFSEGFSEDAHLKLYEFGGTLYDPNTDSFYRVINGKVVYKILPKII